MKWLRFAGQYINTGVVPREGYRVVTQIKGTKGQFTTSEFLPLFGSRGGGGTSTSFNMFFMAPFTDPKGTRFRADYGTAGNDTDLKVDLSQTPYDVDVVYNIDFGKTTKVDTNTTKSNATLTSSGRPIYIASVNNNGTADTRPTRLNYAEFIIFDANGVEVFHGMPVKKGSMEYSGTPAPSNCYFDMVSKTYKVQSGGGGTIGFMDDDRNLTQSISIQHDDYGVKILDDNQPQLEFMNSKYRLFGADITSSTSQFKTFEILLGGYHAEPQPPYPGYIENWQFYQGFGVMEHEALTIDTGFPGDTLKVVSVQTDKVEQANYQGRAHQYTSGGGGGHVNTHLTPVSRTLPKYFDGLNGLSIVNGNMPNMVDVLPGQGGSARYNTLEKFNAGSVNSVYFSAPAVKYRVMPDGKIKVFTSIPYNWIQRAGSGGYRARWKDWVWLQGIRVRLTVLNTPYRL